MNWCQLLISHLSPLCHNSCSRKRNITWHVTAKFCVSKSQNLFGNRGPRFLSASIKSNAPRGLLGKKIDPSSHLLPTCNMSNRDAYSTKTTGNSRIKKILGAGPWLRRYFENVDVFTVSYSSLPNHGL